MDTNKQESQEKCCDKGVCLNHLKDHQLFCNGRCHSINCPFQAVQESQEGVEECPMKGRGAQCSAANKCFHTPTPTVKEESHTQGWEESIEASVKMLCAFSFHIDMAQTAERARTQQGLFEEEFKRMIFKIQQITSQEYERGRGQRENITEMRLKAFEAGRLQGIAEERQHAIDFADHEQRKFLDGFSHHAKCDQCRTALSSLTHKK